MKNILMVMPEVKVTNGGGTRVMMNRSHYFNELGYSANIVTFGEDTDYYRVEQEFKETGRLHPNSKIINFINYFKEKNTIVNSLDNICDYELNIVEEDYLRQVEFFKKKGFIRYFNTNGILIKTKYWVSNSLLKVEYYENNKLKKIKHYRDNVLHKIDDYTDGNVIQERYFTPDGFCFFQKSYLGDNNLLHLFLFDRKTNEVIGFNSYRKLHTYFLCQLCVEDKKENNIIICDGQGSSGKVVDIPEEKAVRVLIFHTNHFESDYKYGAEVQERALRIIENVPYSDCAIILTQQQKNDLNKQFDLQDKLFVIPNTVSTPKSFIKRYAEKKTISIISRYARIKQHDHVVYAVDLLVKNKKISSKDLEVNFYGIGGYKKKLIDLIHSKGLSDIIHVHDYVVDVESIYETSHISLFTSKSEGFGLAVIESMARKTPVISYDINYGPRDMIDDGIDGFLVKPNNIEALSEKIYEVLFERFDQLPNISEAAYDKILKKFTHDKAAELWKSLLENKLWLS